ncbi:SHOCT domain-containing protein [Haloarchaeobius sp. HME9146]|uniref:SHOCT domain-containing protein n=1 Tax=Haloarchaeobius sp. HME9146 TaxID=2978732 RepID=UPI0021BE9250|nr:SHOCT domain-containing protein [Haloarchaeobius sp. HME9146]MCT9095833.1 SHOCT domain-containing protein [Haloarchaeobius sp. HME9146]
MPTRPHDTRLTRVASLLVCGAGLAGLFLDVNNWWLIWVIGYAVVVPIVSILSGEEDEADLLGETNRRMDEALDGAFRGKTTREDLPSSKRDALDTLRERYAQGELSEEQFERKLETLLDTETLEDARARVKRDREPETEPN